MHIYQIKHSSPLAKNTFVPPPPRGNFVDIPYLKVHYLRNILSNVCTLGVGAFGSYVRLYHVTLRYFRKLPLNIEMIIFPIFLWLESCNWCQMKAYEKFFNLICIYASYLIFIIMNINHFLKNCRFFQKKNLFVSKIMYL